MSFVSLFILCLGLSTEDGGEKIIKEINNFDKDHC